MGRTTSAPGSATPQATRGPAPSARWSRSEERRVGSEGRTRRRRRMIRHRRSGTAGRRRTEPRDDTTPSVTASAAEPDGTQVLLDVDLNNDGDFTDTGEAGYASASLTSGSATFDVSPALTDGAYHLRARGSDAAGNEGTSAVSTVVKIGRASGRERG